MTKQQKIQIFSNTLICSIFHAIIRSKNIQITNTYTSIFMMYFIHNLLINMFRLVFRASSGWCYYYKNTNVQIWLSVSPSQLKL